MMGFAHIKCCLVMLVCLLLFTAASASTHLSDGIFGSSVLGERRLLQAKKPCPVNFEFQNYTIITSQCKGPQYLPKFCCKALKDFACPYADELNDLTNDCASTMFSYINLYGKYPPGLFANECKENQQGLECPAPPPRGYVQSGKTSVNHSNGGIQIAWSMLPLMILTVASVAFLQQHV